MPLIHLFYCHQMETRWKRFWARAFPGTNAIRRDKSIAEQRYYLDLTPAEAQAMNLRGMPLAVEHVSGVKAQEAEGEGPVKIEYPRNKDVLGRVVDQTILDDGTILTLCEVQLGGPDETLPQRALKETTMALLQAGHYKVSLVHAFDQNYDAQRDENVVRKYPVELSLTLDPERKDSEVLYWYDATEAYPMQENKYDVYRAGCESRINCTAVDTHDLANEMTTTTNNAAAQQQQQQTSKPKFNDDEISKIITEHAALKADVERFKPLADAYLKKRKEEEDAQRQSVVKNVTDLHTNAQQLMKMLLDSGIEMSDTDRQGFETLIAAGEKTKPEAETLITNLVTSDAREKNLNPSADEMYSNLDKLLANAVLPPMVACSKVFQLANSVLNARATAAASTARVAAKASSAAPITSVPANKKEEPRFSFPINFEQLAQANAKKLKALEMPDTDRDHM